MQGAFAIPTVPKASHTAFLQFPGLFKRSVPTTVSIEPFVLEMGRQLNNLRTTNQRSHVCLDGALVLAAQNHAQYLAVNNLFEHTEDPSKPGYTGSSLLDRGKAATFLGAMNENILLGCDKDDTVCAMKYWIESQAHLNNMMAPEMTAFGVAQQTGMDGQSRWVMVMGQRDPSNPFSGCSGIAV